MIVLNIFKLIDDAEKFITKLTPGKHCIGRGVLFDCLDRKVSKNHILLTVDENEKKVMFKVIHQNTSCYHKNLADKAIEIPSGQEIIVEDQDTFQFVKDTCWYKFRIAQQENILVSSSDAITKQSNSCRKREINNECQSGNPKKSRISNNCVQELLNDIRHIETQDFTGSDIKSEKGSTSKVPVNTNVGFSKVKEEPFDDVDQNVTIIDGSNRATEINNISDPTTSVSDVDSQLTDTKPSIKLEPSETSLSSSTTDTLFGMSNHSSINLEGGACASTCNQNEKKTDKDINELKKMDGSASSNTVLNSSVPDVNDDNNHQNSSNDVKTGDTGTPLSGSCTNPQPGSSSLRREQCWYGPKCYRSNPAHKHDFSHPGDIDYDPDPNDDRPDCQYGTECYRKNIIHRRQFKHSAKPVPKPTGRRKRKAAQKKDHDSQDASSDDEYDFDDPFIGDSSSSASLNETDSDSEWVDSQPVDDEDLQTLFEEAKKITKK